MTSSTEPGVQRGVRVLVDHLDSPAELPPLPAAAGGDIGSVEEHPATGGAIQPQQQPRRGGLARSRFADQGQRLAPGDGETDVVHRPQHPSLALHPGQPELLHQVRHLGDGGGGRVGRGGDRRGVGAQSRSAADQGARVGLPRLAQDLLDRALLDDLAALHHHQPVGAVGGHPEVVRDQQHRGARLAGERLEVIEDLPLHGDVQRAGRLVGDQQLGPPGDGNGDQYPLPHAAGEHVRILLGAHCRIGQPGLGEQLDRVQPGPPAIGQPVGAQYLGDLRADLLDRVQRDRRVLRDQPDPPPPDGSQRLLSEPGELLAGESDAATVDPPVLREQPDHCVRQGALTRAGLADHRDHLALGHGQRHAAHRVHRADRGVVGHPQVIELQHGLARGVWAGHHAGLAGGAGCGHRALAHSPSSAREIRLTDSTVPAMTKPGIAHSHHDVAR
jgi:hypothetical protein